MYDHKWPKWVCNLWKKSSWYYFLSFREPLHVIWYYCTWWTRAPSTERRSLKSSTSSMNNCIPTNCPSNCFPNLDRHIHWHVSLILRITEKNALKTEPGMGRQVDTGKGDPGNPLQTKRPPTRPKSRRKLNPPWDLLPLQRARSMWTVEVPPFHATRGSDTLPSSLPKVQRQGIILLSLHTLKLARRARQITCSGLGYMWRGGTKSQTDVLLSTTSMTAGTPLAWVMLVLNEDMLVQRNIYIPLCASGPSHWYRKGCGCVRIQRWDVEHSRSINYDKQTYCDNAGATGRVTKHFQWVTKRLSNTENLYWPHVTSYSQLAFWLLIRLNITSSLCNIWWAPVFGILLD